VVFAAAVVLTLLAAGLALLTAGDDSPLDRLTGDADQRAERRPNIVLISSDDQRLDEMRFLPQVRELLGEQGLTFDEAITPHPLCCPARAELMTGQLAQNNGVRTNFKPQGGYTKYDNTSSIGTDLQAAGYRTAFLGKMLNGYNAKFGEDPGWDIFNATSFGFSDYYDFVQLDEGEKTVVEGYYTDYVAEKSVEYVDRLAAEDKPFFMWVSHFAPHPSKIRNCSGAECGKTKPLMSPSYRAQTKETGRTPFQDEAEELARQILDSPGYRERDLSDKPGLLQRQQPTSAQKVRRTVQARAGALASLDDAVAALVEQLEEAGELDNTYLVFITDNGYQLGEHGWFGKTLPYEENLRTPMLVRGPGVAPGTSTDQIVSIVDLVATFNDVAGHTSERELDGASMLPIWRGESDTPLHPGGLLVQGGAYKPETGKTGWLYRGVRTRRYTYAEWYDGTVELYDRSTDPHQVDSVAASARYTAVRQELQRRTRVLGECAGPACNRRFGALPQPGDAPE